MNTVTKPPCSPAQVRLIANSMRTDIIDMLEASKSGHPGGSLSAADIVASLWFSGVMEYDATNPDDHSGDHFIISKGHAAPVLYAAFHQLGWIDDEDIPTLRQLGSKLQGHPDSHACPGVEVCSGSLGQGLAISAGIAKGLKLDAKAAGTTPKQVFCLLGDGEMQEGSNWEALMFAAHNGLDNLVAILDLNNLQIDGHVTDVCSLGDIAAKFRAFGFNVTEVDGHDVVAVTKALNDAKAYSDAPSAIICHTIKGKGVSFMEDQQGWHGVAPSHEQAEQARAEIAAQRVELEKEANNG